MTEFRIFEFMARHPRRVFTRELIDACLPGEDVLKRTVDSHMSKLRCFQPWRIALRVLDPAGQR